MASKPTTISRNPFARIETVRVSAFGVCAWCGAPARFRYGSHADGVATRPTFDRRVFCGRSCERAFNG